MNLWMAVFAVLYATLSGYVGTVAYEDTGNISYAVVTTAMWPFMLLLGAIIYHYDQRI